jgi:hypothetical protein
MDIIRLILQHLQLWPLAFTGITIGITMEVIMVVIMVVVMFIFIMKIISTTTIIQETDRIPWQITRPMVITAITGLQRGNQGELLLRIVQPQPLQPVSREELLPRTGHLQHLLHGSQAELLLPIVQPQLLQPASQVEFHLRIVHHHLWDLPAPGVAVAVTAVAVV